MIVRSICACVGGHRRSAAPGARRICLPNHTSHCRLRLSEAAWPSRRPHGFAAQYVCNPVSCSPHDESRSTMIVIKRAGSRRMEPCPQGFAARSLAVGPTGTSSDAPGCQFIQPPSSATDTAFSGRLDPHARRIPLSLPPQSPHLVLRCDRFPSSWAVSVGCRRRSITVLQHSSRRLTHGSTNVSIGRSGLQKLAIWLVVLATPPLIIFFAMS